MFIWKSQPLTQGFVYTFTLNYSGIFNALNIIY